MPSSGGVTGSFPEAASTTRTSKFQTYMHDSTSINGGPLVSGLCKNIVDKKGFFYLLFSLSFSENFVTHNHDQANELHIVMCCWSSVLMFPFHLQLSRPISFWTSDFLQIWKECFYNFEERSQMFVCADEWTLAGLCWIHSSIFNCLSVVLREALDERSLIRKLIMN
jgi:hypothetical protein